MTIRIRHGDVKELPELEACIPEFARITSIEMLRERLDHTSHLILLAEMDDQCAGYKVGYALSRTRFYSWLGAVLPRYRRRGVATALLHHQEEWVRSRGFSEIEVKSSARFPSMLKLLAANGYEVAVGESAVSSDAGIRFLKRML